MSQRFFTTAWALGLALIAWVGIGFVGHSWLALAVTAVIAATFVLGTLELRQFRAQTLALDAALARLDTPPAALEDWLAQLPAPLREPVRQRVETGRGALPGPALTPYLVGLLVMLGMLGTFLGMVLTFQGTVFALEGSAELAAMRAALAAPIRGLGLSFGTSVAGVAASALLGLMSALARRERVESSRRLDGRIAAGLRSFSLSQRREAAQLASQQASLEATLGALGALQAQGEALPTVAEKLSALMDRLEKRGEQLDAQLLERQAQFQREAAAAYADIGRRVGLALEENLSSGLDRALASFHDRFAERSSALLAQVQTHLAEGESRQAQAERERLAAFGEALQATAGVAAQLREDMTAAAARVREDLARAEAQAAEARAREDAREAQALQERGELLARLESLLATVQQTADTQRQAIEGLVASSTEALAQAGSHFTDTLAQSSERFDAALAAGSSRFDQAVTEGSARFTDAMADSNGRFEQALAEGGERASALLAQTGERFGALLQAQSEQAAQQAAKAEAGVAALAGASEAFGQSIADFQSSSARLLEGLQRIEAALASANDRHNEQLAYYVAQAREVIDLSIASQQGLVENLRQLQSRAKGKARDAALAEGDAA